MWHFCLGRVRFSRYAARSPRGVCSRAARRIGDRENCAMSHAQIQKHIWFDSSEDMAGRFGFDAVERQNRSNG